MILKTHSVFIAYHGTYAGEKGSMVYAEKIYNYLEKKGIKDCFFFPRAKFNWYKANVKEIMQSALFMLVCTNNINRTPDGALDFSLHQNLFVELETFYGLTQAGEVSRDDAVTVTIGRDFKLGDEAKLHPLFMDMASTLHCDELNEEQLENIYQWVKNRIEENRRAHEAGLSFEIEKVYNMRQHLPHNTILQRIENAKHIRVMGISNAYLAAQERSNSLHAFLENGGELDALFLDPESENTILRAREEGLLREKTIKNVTINAFNALWDTCHTYENAHLYLYNYIPRFNAIFIDELLILQFYSYNNRGIDNPALCIRKTGENSPLYNFIDATFEYLKNHSTERKEYYDE